MVLGKGLSNEEWIDLIKELLEQGIKRIKLYFMLGKPEGGVEEDLEFLTKLVARIKNPQQVLVSYSFLIPKPHTALSDWRTPSIRDWEREKRIWERGLGKLKIPFSGESPRLAWIQLLLAQGDRLIGEKIPQLLSHPHPGPLGHGNLYSGSWVEMMNGAFTLEKCKALAGGRYGVRENWEAVKEKITIFSQRAGRNPEDIKVIAVTKGVEVSKIEDAISLGLIYLGENRVQEALKKMPLYLKK